MASPLEAAPSNRARRIVVCEDSSGSGIRTGCRGRRTSVGSLTPEQHYWVICPLVEAGLGLEQIRDLLFRLSFEAVISEGRPSLSSLTDMVGDQPAEVRSAWSEVIGRMIAVHSPAVSEHG
jgi:hypothetical protein